MVFKISYGHLYNTQLYSPQSRQREYENTLPRSNSNSFNGVSTQVSNRAYGRVRLPSNSNSGGENSMNNLVNDKLQNKDAYRKMKNKVVYGTSNSIRAHVELNKL